MSYHIADSNHSFVRTNRETIIQRAQILQELGYTGRTIAEICCGDCQRQQQIYRQRLQVARYCGLDLSPDVNALNRTNGVECVQGDALDKEAMAQFAAFEVLFFGPPLSEQCDGHTGLAFPNVTPGFAPFAQLLLHTLHYDGLFICICPNSTNMGDIRRLYEQIQEYRLDVGLRLIHHSYSTLTGNDEETERRLKYVELWFGAGLQDAWEMR